MEADDGYHNPRWWSGLLHKSEPGEQYHKIDNYPAERVSWFDAKAFCRWLSEKRGFEIRLPSEWEWQQAATGGDPKNIYPWGDTFDSLRCNSAESGLGRTTVVGFYPLGASSVGVLDMSGNVWEWCSNCYEISESNDDAKTRRVVRGGSWHDTQVDVRTCVRNYIFSPGSRDLNLGFRLVYSFPIV